MQPHCRWGRCHGCCVCCRLLSDFSSWSARQPLVLGGEYFCWNRRCRIALPLAQETSGGIHRHLRTASTQTGKVSADRACAPCRSRSAASRPETGLLIPSGYINWLKCTQNEAPPCRTTCDRRGGISWDRFHLRRRDESMSPYWRAALSALQGERTTNLRLINLHVVRSVPSGDDAQPSAPPAMA
jgi:hypothetical protein